MTADPELIKELQDIASQVSGGGGSDMTQVTVNSDYTASAGESVWVNAATVPVTITLPAPNQSDVVRVIVDDGSNDVEVAPNAGEDINGDSSNVPMVEDESIKFESDGTDWRVA